MRIGSRSNSSCHPPPALNRGAAGSIPRSTARATSRRGWKRRSSADRSIGLKRVRLWLSTDVQASNDLKTPSSACEGGKNKRVETMNASSGKTSIWLALRNPGFRNLWLASVVSGTCFAAYGTAAFTVMGSDAPAFVISLMSTVAALPYAVFTFPAGALADMMDRKKILKTADLFQAAIAFLLALLALV